MTDERHRGPVDRLVGLMPLDAVLRQVDLNELLDRIDVNAVLDRIDVDRLVDRLDVEQLLAKIELEALIARSMRAASHGTLEVVRSRAAQADHFVDRIVDRVLRRTEGYRAVRPPLAPILLEPPEARL